MFAVRQNHRYVWMKRTSLLECKHVRLATLFVVFPKFLLVFLIIGFTSRNEVLEEHAVIDEPKYLDETVFI